MLKDNIKFKIKKNGDDRFTVYMKEPRHNAILSLFEYKHGYITRHYIPLDNGSSMLGGINLDSGRQINIVSGSEHTSDSQFKPYMQHRLRFSMRSANSYPTVYFEVTRPDVYGTPLKHIIASITPEGNLEVWCSVSEVFGLRIDDTGRIMVL